VFGSDLSFGGGAPGGEAQVRAAEAMLARGQALVDAARPYDGYPLVWHVEAMLVGDFAAMAAALARARGAGPESDPG
jgi:hypothetical protein